MRRTSRVAAMILCAGLHTAASQAGASFTFIYTNEPGEGFFDPAPVGPVGGNPGTTLGEQRRLALEYAADLWGPELESDVPIEIEAEFVSELLPCTATGAFLAAAGALHCAADFPGAEIPDTLYHIALANKLAGVDLVTDPPPAEPDDDRPPSAADILVLANADVDTSVCLGTIDWYYGFDRDTGDDIDFVETVLHELAHGLGFSNFVDELTGERAEIDKSDIYSVYTHDTIDDKAWSEMTTPEVVASADSTGRLVWSGVNVAAALADHSELAHPTLAIHAPIGIVQRFRVGAAGFGPLLDEASDDPPRASANVILVDDATGSPNDACEPLTIASAAAVDGNLALIEPGVCPDDVQVKNAEDAGAIGAIVMAATNNQPPRPLRGDDASITIPSARIASADGAIIQASLAGGVRATLTSDATRFNAADASDRILLNAPRPVQLGSSVSHWDPQSKPNLLMEPATAPEASHGLDLTVPLFVDLGWRSDQDGVADGRDRCIGSNLDDDVILSSVDTPEPPLIGECDPEVTNELDSDGCSIMDGIERCIAQSSSHGKFVKCVTDLTKRLERLSILTMAQGGAIRECAEVVDLP